MRRRDSSVTFFSENQDKLCQWFWKYVAANSVGGTSRSVQYKIIEIALTFSIGCARRVATSKSIGLNSVQHNVYSQKV